MFITERGQFLHFLNCQFNLNVLNQTLQFFLTAIHLGPSFNPRAQVIQKHCCVTVTTWLKTVLKPRQKTSSGFTLANVETLSQTLTWQLRHPVAPPPSSPPPGMKVSSYTRDVNMICHVEDPNLPDPICVYDSAYHTADGYIKRKVIKGQS